jgi:hypothetical protein
VHSGTKLLLNASVFNEGGANALQRHEHDASIRTRDRTLSYVRGVRYFAGLAHEVRKMTGKFICSNIQHRPILEIPGATVRVHASYLLTPDVPPRMSSISTSTARTPATEAASLRAS